MLEIERLAVSYGEVVVLRDVSLTINQGEIVTLIGGNGAGKTTTLKTISGLLAPNAGSIRFEGESIVGLSPDRIVASGIDRDVRPKSLGERQPFRTDIQRDHPRAHRNR